MDENNNNLNKCITIADIYINNCIKEKMNEKQDEREKRYLLLKDRHEEKMKSLNSQKSIDVEEESFLKKQKEIEQERICLQDYKSKYFESLKTDFENSLLKKISKNVYERDFDFFNERLLKEYIRLEFNNSYNEETDLNNLDNLRSFQYSQLFIAFKNAIYTEGEDKYPTAFSDEEKEIIRTLYATKIDSQRKEIYPLNAINRIVVITNYSDVDYFIANEETFKFMPPEDTFWIKSTLRKNAVALYGYNDIFDVDKQSDIKEFPLNVRTEDNHFKAVMFIDNTNRRVFEDVSAEMEETQEETAENYVSELDEDKYPEENDDFNNDEIKQLAGNSVNSLQDTILKYIRGYHNALGMIKADAQSNMQEENIKNNDSSSINNDNDFDVQNGENKDNDIQIIPTEKDEDNDENEKIKKEASDNNIENNFQSRQQDSENKAIEKVGKPMEINVNNEVSTTGCDVILIPVKNLIYATPARIYIGVVPKDSTDGKKVIFYLQNEKDVYKYKGKVYFKVLDDYYNFVELIPMPKEKKIKFKPNNKRVSEKFLRNNFMVARLPGKEITNG